MPNSNENENKIQYTDYQKRAIRRIVDSYMETGNGARFLLSDEVGLGKTIIAKGVIRCLMCKLLKKELEDNFSNGDIEKLVNEHYYYFNVIYICSNMNIAKQNENKLGIYSNQDKKWMNRASCLSSKVMPLTEKRRFGNNGNITYTYGLNEEKICKSEVEFAEVCQDYGEIYGEEDETFQDLKEQVGKLSTRLRILPITLETSIDIKGAGCKEEREYLQTLIRCFSVLEDVEKIENEDGRNVEININENLQNNEDFVTLRKLYERRCDEKFKGACDKVKNDDSTERDAVWETVRKGFAEITMDWLNCEFVIMDEFQNFRDVLSAVTDGTAGDNKNVIQSIFGYETGTKGRKPPYVLLVSATPFRMYMSREESLDEEYAEGEETSEAVDICQVCRFLENRNNDSTLVLALEKYKKTLERYARGDATTKEAVLKEKSAFEEKMTKVFSRMERINVLRELKGEGETVDASGKVEMPCGGIRDLYEYVKELATDRHVEHMGMAQKATSLVSGGVAVTYAEKAPYILSFMNGARVDGKADEGYRIKRDFDKLVSAGKVVYRKNSKSYILKRDYEDMEKPLGEWHGVYENVLEQILDVDAVLKEEMTDLNEAEESKIRRNHPGAARLLWIPSVVRRDKLEGAFQVHADFGKTIMFSDRVVVPRTMAGLISREVRRRLLWLIRAQEKKNYNRDISVGELKKLADTCKKIINETIKFYDGDYSGEIKEIAPVFRASEIGVYAVWSVTGLPIKRDACTNEMRTGEAGDLQLDQAAMWKGLAEYCRIGNLKDVLEEWEYVGSKQILLGIHKATNIKITLYESDDGKLRYPSSDSGEKQENCAIETYYARCIGNSKDDDKVSSIANLQEAFNSPFAPFVFATTSIGQEGLDFHNYADRIVHLSIPVDPTDFEQREGRINRYNCLAIRKALMRWYGGKTAVNQSVREAMDEAFEAARNMLISSDNEKLNSGMIPHWLLARKIENENRLEIAGIKRLVPYFYNSSMMEKYHNMLKLLQLYRSVIGQAEADELLDRLMVNRNEDEVKELYVDFSPYCK